MPHDDCGIFGPSCQFCAVIGELAEPHFIAVLSENLLGVARELFPRDKEDMHAKTQIYTHNTFLYCKIKYNSVYVNEKNIIL